MRVYLVIVFRPHEQVFNINAIGQGRIHLRARHIRFRGQYNSIRVRAVRVRPLDMRRGGIGLGRAVRVKGAVRFFDVNPVIGDKIIHFARQQIERFTIGHASQGGVRVFKIGCAVAHKSGAGGASSQYGQTHRSP